MTPDIDTDDQENEPESMTSRQMESQRRLSEQQRHEYGPSPSELQEYFARITHRHSSINRMMKDELISPTTGASTDTETFYYKDVNNVKAEHHILMPALDEKDSGDYDESTLESRKSHNTHEMNVVIDNTKEMGIILGSVGKDDSLDIIDANPLVMINIDSDMDQDPSKVILTPETPNSNLNGSIDLGYMKRMRERFESNNSLQVQKEHKKKKKKKKDKSLKIMGPSNPKKKIIPVFVKGTNGSHQSHGNSVSTVYIESKNEQYDNNKIIERINIDDLDLTVSMMSSTTPLEYRTSDEDVLQEQHSFTS